MTKRAGIGDVYSIATRTGLGYFQVVGRSHVPEFDVVRVFKGVREAVVVDDLVQEEETFLTVVPVAPLARLGDVQKVGRGDIPSRLRDLPLMRAPGLRDQESGRRWWMFVDPGGKIVGRTLVLTDEEAAMSIDGNPTPSQLAEWISSGWSPSDWT